MREKEALVSPPLSFHARATPPSCRLLSRIAPPLPRPDSLLAELTLLFFLILFTFAASDPQWIGWVRGLTLHCALHALVASAGLAHTCGPAAALFFSSRLCLRTRAWRVGMRFLWPLALIAAPSRAPLCAADDDHFARRADHD